MNKLTKLPLIELWKAAEELAIEFDPDVKDRAEIIKSKRLYGDEKSVIFWCVQWSNILRLS